MNEILGVNVDMVGIIAAVLTTVSFMPQAWKVLKTRHTKDISLFMYILFTLGVFFWLLYGILLGRPPIIIANIITLIFASIILFVKVKEG